MFGSLLALRDGAGDLIYLSQGRRDHPSRLLYGIILCSRVLFPCGTEGTRCMQLHTCQTVLRFFHQAAVLRTGAQTIRNGAQMKLHLNAFLIMQLKKNKNKIYIYIYVYRDKLSAL